MPKLKKQKRHLALARSRRTPLKVKLLNNFLFLDYNFLVMMFSVDVTNASKS